MTIEPFRVHPKIDGILQNEIYEDCSSDNVLPTYVYHIFLHGFTLNQKSSDMFTYSLLSCTGRTFDDRPVG